MTAGNHDDDCHCITCRAGHATTARQIDGEWRDIWEACEHSGLATWHDWIRLGPRDIIRGGPP